MLWIRHLLSKKTITSYYCSILVSSWWSQTFFLFSTLGWWSQLTKLSPGESWLLTPLAFCWSLAWSKPPSAAWTMPNWCSLWPYPCGCPRHFWSAGSCRMPWFCHIGSLPLAGPWVGHKKHGGPTAVLGSEIFFRSRPSGVMPGICRSGSWCLQRCVLAWHPTEFCNMIWEGQRASPPRAVLTCKAAAICWCFTCSRDSSLRC